MDNDGTRDGYVFWSVTADSDAYWEKTLALPDVELVQGPTLEELGIVTETTPEVVDTPAAEAVVISPKTADACWIAAIAAFLSAAGYIFAKKH